MKEVFGDPELGLTDPLSLGGYFPHELVIQVLEEALNISHRPRYSLRSSDANGTAAKNDKGLFRYLHMCLTCP